MWILYPTTTGVINLIMYTSYPSSIPESVKFWRIEV